MTNSTLTIGILALWATLQEQGWHITHRANYWVMRKPDGRQAYTAHDRGTLLVKLSRQFQ